MIDRNTEFWTGESADDINKYLREYTKQKNIEVKSVECHKCESGIFTLKVDQNEGAIEIKCIKCQTKKLLLDSADIWEECKPKAGKCSICKGKNFNVRVGFLRRSTGDVRQVFIGNRCTECGTLGSYVDWDIDYGPTVEMEKNI